MRLLASGITTPLSTAGNYLPLIHLTSYGDLS